MFIASIAAAQMTMKRVGGLGIVFESGLGERIDAWEQVAPVLAACGRVVLCDRPGIVASAPRTRGAVLASTVADRLMSLLEAIDARAALHPCRLGGLYVQSFARPHPAGVVLVDSARPFEPPGVFVLTVPPAAGSTSAAEEAGVAASVRAMLTGPPFPPVPLVVLAATNHGGASNRAISWRSVQAQTAALSPRGRLEVTEGSGHFIQNDGPRP
jgi:alpha-beta hydrolase superfamily lysophospholipase